MKREEKRRKFHESLLNMLYPPPPPQQQDNNLNLSRECLQSAQIPDDEDDEEGEKSSSSSSDGNQKLTRAQRKRLRKKKIREAASQRRPVIGPLLPTPPTDASTIDPVIRNEPPCVRHNAAEEPVAEADNCGDQASLNNQSKIKQRRMAKKQIRDKKEQDSSH